MSDTNSQDGNSSASSEPEDPLASFAHVIAALRRDAVPDLALETRRRKSPNPHIPSQLTCMVIDRPLFGAYSIVYELEFSDGARWMLKVPKAGHEKSWDEAAARSLRTEALAMKFLQKKTQIPVPTVHGFDARRENCIHVPYILMEKITGVSLEDFWYDRNFSREERRARNVRLLPELAAAMLQMNAFVFDRGGAPIFESEERISGVGPWRQKDFNDEYRHIFADSGNDEMYTNVFRDIGPFGDPRDQISWSLQDRRQSFSTGHEMVEGMEKMLELFVSWIPDADAPLPHGDPCTPEARHRTFVLSHADFDVQNIIVTDDGHLAGIIDWDGVAVVPRLLGNERYPLWLTHDWNPMQYNYDEAEDQVRPHDHHIGDGCCPATDLPEDLIFYREVYQSAIADLSKKAFGNLDPNLAGREASDLEESVQRVRCLTQNSLIITALDHACASKFGCLEIMQLIWNRIEEVVDGNSDADSSVDSGSDGASDTNNEDSVTFQAVADSNHHSVEHLEQSHFPVVPKSSVDKGSDEDEEDTSEETPSAPEEVEYNYFMFYDMAVSLTRGSLDQGRCGKLKDGFLRLFD